MRWRSSKVPCWSRCRLPCPSCFLLESNVAFRSAKGRPFAERKATIRIQTDSKLDLHHAPLAEPDDHAVVDRDLRVRIGDLLTLGPDCNAASIDCTSSLIFRLYQAEQDEQLHGPNLAFIDFGSRQCHLLNVRRIFALR